MKTCSKIFKSQRKALSIYLLHIQNRYHTHFFYKDQKTTSCSNFQRSKWGHWKSPCHWQQTPLQVLMTVRLYKNEIPGLQFYPFFPVMADKVPRVLHPRLNENWVSFHSKHLLPVIYHTHEISSSILLPPLKDPIVPPHKSTWENEGKTFPLLFQLLCARKGKNQQLIWKQYHLCYYNWRNCVKSTWYMTL